MRIIRIVSLLLCAIISMNSVVMAVQDETQQIDQSVTDNQGYHGIDAGNAYLGSEKIVDNMSAALVYEVNSDTVMYAWNADERVYPSSLVKIVTALIAIERNDIQETVTVSQSALDSVPYYAASSELKADEEILLSDLLYCMLVGSANDAAAVIAEHISGSQDAFVQQMNTYATSLGCSNTQFVNAHGLHDENQYTTARDLIAILSAAEKNEVFMSYFSTVSYTVPATNKSEARSLVSGNFLMSTEKLQRYFDARVIGGRTGIADDDTRCLATIAEENGMRILCVVMGSQSTLADDGKTETYGSFAETTELLDACFEDNCVVQIIYEGQALRQCPVSNGENDVILASTNSVSAVLPSSATLEELVFQYNDIASPIEAPVSAGQKVSEVQVLHRGLCVARSELVAMNDVRYVESVGDNKDTQIKEHSFDAPFVVIISISGSVIAFLVGIRVVRYFRSRQTRNKKRVHKDRRGNF